MPVGGGAHQGHVGPNDSRKGNTELPPKSRITPYHGVDLLLFEDRLSEENIPRGVSNAWDPPYIGS